MEYSQEDKADLPWSSYVFAVWNLIIRPPRQKYSQYDLVKTFPHGRFRMNSDTGVDRKDFTVANARGLKLACTLFEPILDEPCQERACVIYCHGNSSCRMSGFELVPVLCPLNIAVACFDFSGSGWSGGDYVSLGFHEQEDLRAVIEYLRGDRGGFTRIGVWGYSMGAVAALMHAASDMSIAGVLADSPFSDLTDLIKDICCHRLNLPPRLINTILPIVRLAIQRKAQFDIYEVSPSKCVDKCFVPALFLHGDMDDFIPPDHSSLLESKYSGESMRIVMPHLTHNCKRPWAFLDRAAVFFVRALRWEPFLPKGMTEEQLSRKARRHLNPDTTPRRDPNEEQAQVRNDHVTKLTRSSKAVERCLGFIQVACELCHAYQGADMVPISGSSTGRCPVRFSGKIELPGDQGEMALCWSQEEHAERSMVASDGNPRRMVFFAVFSSTSVSLTRVTLAPVKSTEVARGGSGHGRSVKGFAGFVCTSVEPLALAEVQLSPGTPTEIVLRILHDCIEFSIGETSISLEERGTCEDLLIWCVQWKPEEKDDERSFGSIGPLSLQLRSSPEHNGNSSQAKPKDSRYGKTRGVASTTREAMRKRNSGCLQPMKQRLADHLATLCFDKTSTHPEIDAPKNEHPVQDTEGFLFPDVDKALYRSHMALPPDFSMTSFEV